jgi:hypothetical protein
MIKARSPGEVGKINQAAQRARDDDRPASHVPLAMAAMAAFQPLLKTLWCQRP